MSRADAASCCRAETYNWNQYGVAGTLIKSFWVTVAVQVFIGRTSELDDWLIYLLLLGQYSFLCSSNSNLIVQTLAIFNNAFHQIFFNEMLNKAVTICGNHVCFSLDFQFIITETVWKNLRWNFQRKKNKHCFRSARDYMWKNAKLLISLSHMFADNR